ncbi:MAG TPA: site-specific DNA-methyltransferase [Anaerolineales bacterium]|nr:site-specific DNA-methyltransferase [Anaerolineales bacterium]HLO28012.1 site-specific DNA-methyltransferase [Anaerolineales bacterium]
MAIPLGAAETSDWQGHESWLWHACPSPLLNMPELTWPGKKVAQSHGASSLIKDSIVYPNGYGYPDIQPASRLILGDNLAVMTALLPECEGRINLIYADPPFFTNRKYSARIGRGEDSRKPGEWELAEGYHDHWDNLDAYLGFLYERLALMYQLLAPNGTLYLHLDWHADAYARILLDEIFGADHFLNEIIWAYHGPSPIRSAFNRKHDTILAYVKSEDYTFNVDQVREPYHQNTVKTFNSSAKAGFGKVPDLKRGKVPEDWWYFPVIARLHNERTGYPTQKPIALLERMILASSNPGDVVADFFCGSGTAPFVAAQRGRSFIACDATFRALHTTRSRLTVSQAPFTLERDADFSIPVSPASKSTKVHLSKDLISLETHLTLDYWEVDPDWDGITFKSAAQAKRPTRRGNIPCELKIKAGSNISVRLVTAKGEQYQLNI